MKTLREARHGKALLRLLTTGVSYAGVVLAGNKVAARIDGDDAEDVWQRLLRDAGRGDPGYIGYDEARATFLRYFPGGFGSDAYVAAERNYKIAAREKLIAEAPVEAVATGTGYTEAAIRAFNRTNLVYPVEKTRMRDALRGSGGDTLLQAAARFTLEPDAATLATMERILRSHDNARWTVITYLPFLWAPDRHMYLKPQVTTDFATRVGHPFAHAYGSSINLDTYCSLLDLAAEAEREVAVLQPRDRIDTQSFLWVVGDYQPGDEAVED